MSKKHKKSNFIEHVTKPIPIKEKTQVDIVIPVFSMFEMLEKCLISIPAAMQDVKYKIYLVDDFSPDLQEKGKVFYQHLRQNLPNLGGILQHSKNEGFPKSVNDGSNLGSSETIMILSTDVLLTEGAGKILVEHLIGSNELGITFPKLLFFANSTDSSRPANKVQSCGTVFDVNLNPYHRYLGWDANHPFVNRVVDLNAMTGACFVIRRKLWYQLKGFDIAYGLGTHEDVDLSLRVRMTGAKIRYLPQSVGFHGVGLSSLSTKNPFPLDRNYQYFMAKFTKNGVPYDDWIF